MACGGWLAPPLCAWTGRPSARGPRQWSTVDRLRNPEGVCNLGRWKQVVWLGMKGDGALAWAEADHGGTIAADEVSSSEIAGISFPATQNKNKTTTMTSATRRTRYGTNKGRAARRDDGPAAAPLPRPRRASSSALESSKLTIESTGSIEGLPRFR